LDDRIVRLGPAGGGGRRRGRQAQDARRIIGHRLAEIRRTRGLTQQQLANRMGVTKGRVSQSERGKICGQDVLAGYAPRWAGDSTKRSTSTTETSPPSPDHRAPPDRFAVVVPSSAADGRK
jgi:DNA-binding XRE family transcriptional regulator